MVTPPPSTLPSIHKSGVWVSISSIILIHLLFIIPIASSYHTHSLSSSSSDQIPYKDHCNYIIPEATAIPPPIFQSNFLQFRDGYYNGGDEILGQIPQQQPFRRYPKAVSFRVQSALKTNTEDVFKVQGILTFRGPNTYPLLGNFSIGSVKSGGFRTRRPHLPVQHSGRLRFSLHGFWSGSSGKLCMVGKGNGYSKGGKFVDLSVVFKLNYPRNSTISTSLVKGSLESLGLLDSPNYFTPIYLLAVSDRNYDYTVILNENKGMFNGGGKEGLAYSLQLGRGFVQGICSIIQASRYKFVLEYGSDCNDAKNCTPVSRDSRENGFLPNSMAFSGVQCSELKRMRLLIGFYNTTFSVYSQPLVPERMLVGEGVWDDENNRLGVVACQILNVAGSLIDSSVGDCSIRLSLWFPAVLSIKNRSSAMGRIWSTKTTGDSGYFDRIFFRSLENRRSELPGLKYEYTQIGKLTKSCVEKKTAENKGKRYPGGYSNDMRFDMRVGNDYPTWGYGQPLSVGEKFYEDRNGFMQFGHGSSVQEIAPRGSLLNISYMISFTPPADSKLSGRDSSTNMSQILSTSIQLSAEGVYNTETGGLCMIGCWSLGLDHQRSTAKTNSTDCEIIIIVQFPELNAKSKNYVKGSIRSTREDSDPLYFKQLTFTSASLSTKAAVESIWRMDLEITMVLISNTLVCLFLVMQLFYIKKHPDVLPSISLMMLIILTLGHMIPLVLNFEALFLTNRNRQNLFTGSGGWLEVNEVIVRVVTMIAFLLLFRLLQLTWSSRLGDGYQKALWLAEKRAAVYVFLPLCLVGGCIALVIHWRSNSYGPSLHKREIIIDYHSRHSHSLWEDLRSYAGLLLDGFLLPQILLNIFWNSKDKALSPAFYFGTTAVRLLPHAYDLYRSQRFGAFRGDPMIYANPGGDFFSTAWDVIIPCGGLLFAIIIYFQQRFGGCCFIPPRFRASIEYEKVPIVNGE